MSKVIKYKSDMTEKLLSGINKTVDLVAQTMGPVASNVVISKKFGSPRITKDGITVINAVEFDDEIENTAASLIKEASAKTNTESGDGTTGTAVLLREIYKNGLAHIVAGGNKIQIRNGIQKAANEVVRILKRNSKSISDKESIRQVAKISSNQSDEIADVLADVFDKMGTRGVIKVETGTTTETVSKIVSGCQYDVGYLSPYFCTNEKMEADLDNPFVVFCGKKLSNLQEMLPLLQSASSAGKPLFIMCEDMEGEALATIIFNRMKGFQVCVVKSPSYGENRKRILEDLAILTGAQVISDETGVKIENAQIGTPQGAMIIGTAKRIIVTRDSTTIISAGDENPELAARINQLDAQIENEKDDYVREKLEERRAKLTGGVAVISVGGKTESEMKEKKDLVDDAFSAVKASLKNGIVAGGGIALVKVYQELKNEVLDPVFVESLQGDEEIGARILIDSLCAPLKTIVNNSGRSGDVILNNIMSKYGSEVDSEQNYGYDVLNDKYCNVVDAGIIDPTSVIISEVQNASSIAGLLLTSVGAIVDVPEKTDSKAAPAAPSYM